MAREAEHRGKPTTSVKRTVTCLRSASMAHFSCKMLDEKICRAVVVTFAVASGRSKEPGERPTLSNIGDAADRERDLRDEFS